MNDSEQTEGEYLTALGFFEPFPFRLLITFAATFPVNGDSFKACSHAQVKATAFAIYYFYIPLFVNF